MSIDVKQFPEKKKHVRYGVAFGGLRRRSPEGGGGEVHQTRRLTAVPPALFFAISIFKSSATFRDFQRPEYVFKHFVYFILAKLSITYGMDLMVNIFDVCNGIVTTAASSVGGITSASAALPSEITTAIGDVGFLASIPLWLVTLLGSLFITALSFIMILTVYGRFFKLYMYAALSPVALASFAGENTTHFGKAFLRSYIGVCMEGAVIVLACIIFSAFTSSGATIVDPDASVVTRSGAT